MKEERIKELIKASIAIGIISIAIIIAIVVCIKYNLEGDKNIPFNISKITIVSTAEGVQNENTEEKWNLNICQNNDIYFSVEKNNESTENEIIKNLTIENIKVTKAPNIGEVKYYMPNSSDGKLFSYNSEYVLEDNKLTFKGGAKSNSKTLEIGNQGGTVVMRIANTNIANYVSNDEEEINHDGSLINKVEKNIEDIEFEVNFDIKIVTQEKNYIANITLNMPCEKELIEQGTVSKEIKDDIVFKRVRK